MKWAGISSAKGNSWAPTSGDRKAFLDRGQKLFRRREPGNGRGRACPGQSLGIATGVTAQVSGPAIRAKAVYNQSVSAPGAFPAARARRDRAESVRRPARPGSGERATAGKGPPGQSSPRPGRSGETPRRPTRAWHVAVPTSGIRRRHGLIRAISSQFAAPRNMSWPCGRGPLGPPRRPLPPLVPRRRR